MCVQMALIINFVGEIKYFRGIQIFQEKWTRGRGSSFFMGGLNISLVLKGLLFNF